MSGSAQIDIDLPPPKMRRRIDRQEPAREQLGWGLLSSVYRLSPSDDPDRRGRGGSRPHDPGPAGREDLPYRVEVWDEAGADVETVLAITASASIGYAAFYAATREYPTRLITLRHKSSVVSRWNGPAH